jgi:oligosaccharide repeat unit polymerase
MLLDLFIFIVVAAAYLISTKRFADIFTPLFIYVCVWCSSLILYNLRLVNYDELEIGTIWIIAVSMIAFTCGCVCAGSARRPSAATFEITLRPLEKAIKVLIFINLTGMIFFAARMAGTFGIQAYFNDPSEIRLNYEDLGRIGWLALLLLANYPVFVGSLVHYLASRKIRWFTVVGLCLPMFQGYLTMSRNALAIPVATGLFAWIYFRGWKTPNRRLLKGSVLVLGAVAVYFVAVGAWYGKLVTSENSSYNKQDFNLSSQIALQLVDPYIYVTAGIPTLQAAMGDVHYHLWGTRTFFPIARLLYAAGLLRERPENASLEFYFVPIPSNVYTNLFSFYEDFGIAGMILCPFVLGFLETKLYLRMRDRPDLFSISGAAACMVIAAYSVFIALNSTIQVWYFLAAMLIISRQLDPKLSKVKQLAARMGQVAGHHPKSEAGL